MQLFRSISFKVLKLLDKKRTSAYDFGIGNHLPHSYLSTLRIGFPERTLGGPLVNFESKILIHADCPKIHLRNFKQVFAIREITQEVPLHGTGYSHSTECGIGCRGVYVALRLGKIQRALKDSAQSEECDMSSHKSQSRNQGFPLELVRTSLGCGYGNDPDNVSIKQGYIMVLGNKRMFK